jgi:hypothetical protein
LHSGKRKGFIYVFVSEINAEMYRCVQKTSTIVAQIIFFMYLCSEIFKGGLIMQVSINPNLYGEAQTYAEKQGLNLNLVIEKFLERFISAQGRITSQEQLPDVVLNLLGAAEGTLDADDLNGRTSYYQHLEEKYK